MLDVHIHCIAEGSDGKGSFVSNKFKRSPAFRILKYFSKINRNEKNITKFFSTMLINNIEDSRYLKGAVILALDGIYDSKGKFDKNNCHYYVSNDFVANLCKNSKKMFFGASVNPTRKDAINELERVKEAGAVLVKLIPNSQNIDLSLKKYIPFFQKLEKLNLPLLSHTGYEHTLGVSNQRLGDPFRLRTALDEGVTVIAAHSGTGNWGSRKLRWLPGIKETFNEFVVLVNDYSNLYGDISAFGSPARGIYVKDVLTNEKVKERLIHGSDFPVPTIPLYFFSQLKNSERRALKKIKNPFDKDITLKKMLGFPDNVFTRATDILNLPL